MTPQMTVTPSVATMIATPDNSRMSTLDEAMKEHMAYIVLLEHRPFSYRDFMRFEVDGKEYRMTPGTFRNKILKLRKLGEIELAYNAGTAFYTLKGHGFGKPITPNHTGVSSTKSDALVRLIQNLPMDKNAVHNIRLKFELKGSWPAFSAYNPKLPINHTSKDILVPTWNIDDLLVRVTVHRTDTVSVSIACSLAPVAADINGVIRLSNALTRVEERLTELLKDIPGNEGGSDNDSSSANITGVKDHTGNQHQKVQVPNHRSWIVTMWHFGADSLIEYTGDKFSVTWGTGQHALVRVYTKIMNDKKTRIRLEGQEYPNKTLPAAIEEKLNSGGCTRI